jgi:hypothetical protein
MSSSYCQGADIAVSEQDGPGTYESRPASGSSQENKTQIRSQEDKYRNNKKLQVNGSLSTHLPQYCAASNI